MRSGGTGVPAPSLFSHGATGAGRRRRWVPLIATAALLVVAGIGVSALTGWGSDGGTLGLDGFETSDDGGSDVGSGYGAMGEDTYGSYDTDDSSDSVGTPSSPPNIPDDTTSGSATGTYVVLPYGDTWADDVENTFNAYFEGINSGDPERAWMQLSSSRQQQTSLDEFADAVRTSYDSEFVVQDASYTGGRAHVWLEFTSTQDPALGPAPGEDCTRWSLDYVLLEQPSGTFLIDEVAGHGNSTGHAPCQ
jgi:hypothetical protein